MSQTSQTWGHDITIIPLVDTIGRTMFDRDRMGHLAKAPKHSAAHALYQLHTQGRYEARKSTLCHACDRPASFYVSWQERGLTTREVVMRACPAHAAEFAARFRLGIDGRKGPTHYGAGHVLPIDQLPELVDRYEKAVGKSLPSFDGGRLLPGEVDVMLAILTDPKQRLVRAHYGDVGRTVVSADAPRIAMGMAPIVHLHPRQYDRLVDFGIAVKFVEVNGNGRSQRVILSASGRKLADKIHRKVGGGIP